MKILREAWYPYNGLDGVIGIADHCTLVGDQPGNLKTFFIIIYLLGLPALNC